MAEIILKTQLESYLEKMDDTYFELYGGIQNAATKIWNRPRLQWYTGHGVRHSRRIIFLLDQLCGDLLFDPETRQPACGLNPTEVFLLLSAAWLHDIGMQDLSEMGDLSVDQMEEHAWDEVRKRHPQRSHDIIMAHAVGSEKANEFKLGIGPDPKIHAPLALICKGHGSDYFEEVIEYFKNRTFDVDGTGSRIRGELLTSLLLMADELDLHNSRAPANENFPLSRVSKLHHYRHHYIDNVKIDAGLNNYPRSYKTIHITYAFPEGSKEWAAGLQKWIGDKLVKESRRTGPHILNGFDARFSWADPVVTSTSEKALAGEKRKMDDDVRLLLKSQTEKVIDWKICTKMLKERFRERVGGVVCVDAGKNRGVDAFFTFIECHFHASADAYDPQFPFAMLKFSPPCRYHHPGEVMGDMGELLGISTNGEGDADKDPAGDWESMYSRIKARDKFQLVVFSHLSETDERLKTGVIDEIVARIEPGNNHLLFLVNTAPRDVSRCRPEVCELPDRFEEHHFYDYFIETGNTGAEARNKADKMMKLLELNPATPGICRGLAEIIDNKNNIDFK